MTISSRTPEGFPSECSLCGARTNIEFSDPGQDAPCPNCRHLIWESEQLVRSVSQFFSEPLGVRPGLMTVNTRLKDLGVDSLDIVELVMELEEEFDVRIPDSAAENIGTIGDVVRYLQQSRRVDVDD